ncbi:MAG: peptide-methionine (S)-S-oxide reductase MsrA [Spirochaetota bacterium]
MAVEYVTLGGGCFWCLEAIFERIDGVESVVPGYAGGTTDHPSYEQVCTGETGHAEVVQIAFDPERLSFEDILNQFWKAHDPTTVNRQGADVGSQYRSIILYNDEQQRQQAEESKKALEESGYFDNPIVTEIKALDTFYPAEEYHHNYFEKHPYAGYCTFVIRPKLKKLELLK